MIWTGDARDLCLITPQQSAATGTSADSSLWQCSLQSPGSTRSVASSLTLPCSPFLLCYMSSCSSRDSPTHYRTITTAKLLPNGLGMLLSKWSHLWFTTLTWTCLYWGRVTGPWSHSRCSCYSLHKKLPAVSKILLHFLSQNSSVAAYTSASFIEYSETTFGLRRVEENWSLGVCQVRVISPSHFVFSSLVFPFQEPVVAVFLFWDF